MNVADAARAAGISPSGLRWYESKGVLPPAARSLNGYRNYTPGDVSKIRLVVTLRRLGLSAGEAGRLSRLAFEGEGAGDELPAALQRQQATIARRRADLAWLESELGDLKATLRAVGRRHIDPQRVTPIGVLFLCNANSGRSQIGEALLTKLGGERFRVQSAGGQPAPVSDVAVTVLSEVGIDWRGARSKGIDAVSGPFDYVISLSDEVWELCAAIGGAHSTLQWHFPDPSGAGSAERRLAAYRRIRDELSYRLVPLVDLALRTAAAGAPASQLEEVSDG